MGRAFSAGSVLGVGDSFSSGRRTISESDVAQFAALTGDRHPQHVDAAWAAGSLFGERVAHGLLVFSCAAGLLPLDPERVVALRRVRQMVFKRPVRLGESVRIEGEVQTVRPLDEDNDLVGAGLRVLRGDDQLAVRAALEIIWKRAAASPRSPVREGLRGEEGR
jgi:acyl dehydratase